MKLLLKTAIALSLAGASMQSQAQSDATAAETTPAVTAPSEAPLTSTESVPAESASADAAAMSEEEIRAQEESFRDSREDEKREARKGIALAARVSTLGLGVEVVKSVHKRVNLRAQGNFFNYNDSIKEDDIDYDGKLKLQTFGALIDFHPFVGGLRLSAGVYNNANKIDLKASCKTECEVGDFTVRNSNPGDNPQLFGGVDFKSVAPYLGFGYGNAMRGFPLHFALDVGVLFQGAPRFNLDASGIATVTNNNDPTQTPVRRDLGNDPEFQAQLADEERNAEDSAKDFKYYPVISMTIGYRFRLF